MTQSPLADGALSAEPQLRGHRELGAQLAALGRWQGSGPTAEFYRGASAALAWLLAGGPSPLTGRRYPRPVTTLAVSAELGHADELVRSVGPLRRHYVIGLEHALSWAGQDTTVPPLPPSR